MDEIETLALDLGSKMGLDELQSLTKILTFILYGRGIERNGSNATAQAMSAPAKAAPAKAAKGKTPRPPLPAVDPDDEPGF
jgi:hypothetical protein